MTRLRSAAMLVVLSGLVPVLPERAALAAQLCGCANNTTGRVRATTVVPPGSVTCRATESLVCWNQGGVTEVGAGAGLEATPVNPITGAGTIAVNAPTCSGTDKLTWTGAAFQCVADQTGGGGAGLSARYSAGSTSLTSTNSNSFVDVPDMTASFSLANTSTVFITGYVMFEAGAAFGKGVTFSQK